MVAMAIKSNRFDNSDNICANNRNTCHNSSFSNWATKEKENIYIYLSRLRVLGEVILNEQ